MESLEHEHGHDPFTIPRSDNEPRRPPASAAGSQKAKIVEQGPNKGKRERKRKTLDGWSAEETVRETKRAVLQGKGATHGIPRDKAPTRGAIIDRLDIGDKRDLERSMNAERYFRRSSDIGNEPLRLGQPGRSSHRRKPSAATASSNRTRPVPVDLDLDSDNEEVVLSLDAMLGRTIDSREARALKSKPDGVPDTPRGGQELSSPATKGKNGWTDRYLTPQSESPPGGSGFKAKQRGRYGLVSSPTRLNSSQAGSPRRPCATIQNLVTPVKGQELNESVGLSSDPILLTSSSKHHISQPSPTTHAPRVDQGPQGKRAVRMKRPSALATSRPNNGPGPLSSQFEEIDLEGVDLAKMEQQAVNDSRNIGVIKPPAAFEEEVENTGAVTPKLVDKTNATAEASSKNTQRRPKPRINSDLQLKREASKAPPIDRPPAQPFPLSFDSNSSASSNSGSEVDSNGPTASSSPLRSAKKTTARKKPKPKQHSEILTWNLHSAKKGVSPPLNDPAMPTLRPLQAFPLEEDNEESPKKLEEKRAKGAERSNGKGKQLEEDEMEKDSSWLDIPKLQRKSKRWVIVDGAKVKMERCSDSDESEDDLKVRLGQSQYLDDDGNLEIMLMEDGWDEKYLNGISVVGEGNKGKLGIQLSGTNAEHYCSQFIDSESLCAFCNEALPKSPSPELLKLYSQLSEISQAAPTASNPNARNIDWTQSISVCALHRAETCAIPLGIKAGYPRVIDWEVFEERCREERVVKRLEQLLAIPGKSSYWLVTKRDMEALGGRRSWLNIKVQQASGRMDKMQPGFYGDQGRSIMVKVFQSYLDTQPQAVKHTEAISPLTLDDVISHVFVPEIAIMFVQEDLGAIGKGASGRALSIKIVQESVAYGRAIFPTVSQLNARGRAQTIVQPSPSRGKRRAVFRSPLQGSDTASPMQTQRGREVSVVITHSASRSRKHESPKPVSDSEEHDEREPSELESEGQPKRPKYPPVKLARPPPNVSGSTSAPSAGTMPLAPANQAIRKPPSKALGMRRRF